MSSSKQKIEGDNNKQTIIGTANFIGEEYKNLLEDSVIDLGIINSIIDFVLLNSQESNINNSRADKLLNTTQKIKINFKDSLEREDITNFCKYASEKIFLIDIAFSKLDSSDQNDIHSFILSKYSQNRTNGLNNMTNFYSLCNEFIAPKFSKNPKYQNIAKSFVLFFFQDCTIFEKTNKEKENDIINNPQLKFDF